MFLCQLMAGVYLSQTEVRGEHLLQMPSGKHVAGDCIWCVWQIIKNHPIRKGERGPQRWVLWLFLPVHWSFRSGGTPVSCFALSVCSLSYLSPIPSTYPCAVTSPSWWPVSGAPNTGTMLFPAQITRFSRFHPLFQWSIFWGVRGSGVILTMFQAMSIPPVPHPSNELGHIFRASSTPRH